MPTYHIYENNERLTCSGLDDLALAMQIAFDRFCKTRARFPVEVRDGNKVRARVQVTGNRTVVQTFDDKEE